MRDQEMSYGSDYHFIPVTSLGSGAGEEVAADIYCCTIQIVNVCFVGYADQGDWILVDAGMPKSADDIVRQAEKRFGPNRRPKAIVLTHGHFDHVGAVIELVEHWGVSVYAHEAELPYLTGKKPYPAPDPSAAGGLVAKMSPFFPVEPINLGRHAHPLSADGTIPHMPGWRWIHTPGHTPGHVSLFRDSDRALIAGDAFVTVKQESIYKVFAQEAEISGPPRYFTPDWPAARESVNKLQALHPELAVTGHGMPLAGKKLADGLQRLVEDFDRIALPNEGKYVKQ